METNARVELPINSNCKVLRDFKLIGDLKKTYGDKLTFVKYIYLDPVDKKLKGANPPDNLPLVKDAYITVVGEMKAIMEFSKDLVS